MSATISTDGPVSSNGSKPATDATARPAAPSAADAIIALRRKPRNLHLAGGFGPLLVGVILFLLMMWAAPSVAPEHVVQRPAATPTTTVAPQPGTATP